MFFPIPRGLKRVKPAKFSSRGQKMARISARKNIRART
jgi:hypothetical protein